MKKDEARVRVRSQVELLAEEGLSDKEIAEKLRLEVGARNRRKTVLWYKWCLVAQKKQRKAFEKHGYELYSIAGKIAQRKHPWFGHELGKKYGRMLGKKRIRQIKESGKAKEYFSAMARKLQDKYPEQSRRNMRKAIVKMKREGTFIPNSTKGAIACMKKYPFQLKEMSKRAHKLYPDLAYRSRKKQRKNSPYWYKGCRFDSNQEREVCKMLVGHSLIEVPIEGKNTQFRIHNYQIDFFIKEKVFLEFHPPISFGNKIETEASYFKKRRQILDDNGYKDYPLIVVSHIKKAKRIIEELKKTYFSSHDSALYLSKENTS